MQNLRYITISLAKILLVMVLAIVLFFVGLMVGYGIFGNGSPKDVFSPVLWQHIMEFMH
ncbi:MAG TPA: DNA-directed RNA polymerase subunit beta [Candidatus Tetragenococcus pullicola]|nr:DNA-directed RNA polymerase subunit beta [Candidatus Tetragenococcus pullicola]